MGVRVAVVCLALMVGCGEATDPPRPATRAEFISLGDKVCKRANDRLAASERRTRHDAFEGRETAPVRLLDFNAEVARGLRDLTPPTGDEEALTIVVAFEHYAALLNQNTNARFAGNPTYKLPRLHRSRERVSKLMEAYGFLECGTRWEGIAG